MHPLTKLNTFVFTVTTTIVYFIWKYLASMPVNNFFIELIITFVLSLSFYNLVFKCILLICEHHRILRKLILGETYLEGVWTGFYIYKNTINFYYEICYQSMKNISIIGKSFARNDNYICSWTILEPRIDIDESKLLYCYELIEEKSPNTLSMGYAKATIFRDKYKKAIRIEGFAVDSDDNERQIFISEKASDDPYKEINLTELLQMSQKIYKDNQINLNIYT